MENREDCKRKRARYVFPFDPRQAIGIASGSMAGASVGVDVDGRPRGNPYRSTVLDSDSKLSGCGGPCGCEERTREGASGAISAML